MLRPMLLLIITASLALLPARTATADLLFSNFDGDPFGGALWTGGGPCEFTCFALGDNFIADDIWIVSGFTFYMVSEAPPEWVGMSGRFAVLTAAGSLVVPPTNTAVNVTDTGLMFTETHVIYKLEIAGLEVALTPGEYQFRYTNYSFQSVYPAYGTPSVQSISPGLQQLVGSPTVDSLISTEVLLRDENWAFQVHGTIDTVFEHGFEAP